MKKIKIDNCKMVFKECNIYGDIFIIFENEVINKEEDTDSKGNDVEDNTDVKSRNVNVREIRRSSQLSKFKKKIRKRDIHCQCCGSTTKNLEVHHILPVAKYPQLACDENNAVALCTECHKKYHVNYKGQEGAVSFSEFMKKYANRFY